MDLIEEKMKELNQKIYGPKFCIKCDKIQPVMVGELAGSHEHKYEGSTFTVSFMGAYACRVCGSTIEVK